MERDNVTPFRPRKPQPKQPNGLGLKSHRSKAVLVHVMTLLAFGLSFVLSSPPASFIGIGVAIAAVAVAASNRHDSMPWAATHHEHAIRTLIIGYCINLLAKLLLFIGDVMLPVTFVVAIAVMIWTAIRSGVGLVLAILRKPIPRPTGILF